jgi:hypothetical protein
MKDRCLNSAHRSYPGYGGRGIGVDPRWLESFAAFIADVGPRPSPRHSLDRVDNDRGYWPDNVRWATRSEQASNRRRAIYKLSPEQVREIRSKRLSGSLLRELASEYGVSTSQISLITLGKEWVALD